MENIILDFDDRLESVYDVYDSISRLEPILDDLEQLIDGSTNTDIRLKLRPIEKVELIDSIGFILRDAMTTSDINIFLAGYGIDFEPKEIAQSKRLYVKGILANEPERVILEVAKDLGLYSDVSLTKMSNSIDNDYVKEQM